MSYLKRSSLVTPFGQITNSTAPSVFNRFDTASVNWLTTSGTNGYSASNSKMFITAQFSNSGAGGPLFGFRLNSSADKWKWGGIVGGASVSRAQHDEVMIDYSQTTEYDLPTSWATATSNPQSIECRFNVVRMEAL